MRGLMLLLSLVSTTASSGLLAALPDGANYLCTGNAVTGFALDKQTTNGALPNFARANTSSSPQSRTAPAQRAVRSMQ